MRIATFFPYRRWPYAFTGDSGVYEIELNIKNPFLPNTYVISVGAFSTLGGEVIDYVPEALRFEVIELSADDYVYHRYKEALVQIKGEWGGVRRIGNNPRA